MKDNVVDHDGFVSAVGSEEMGQAELILRYDDSSLTGAAHQLAHELLGYVRESRRRLLADEKMGWATSVIKFRGDGNRLIVEALSGNNDLFTDRLDNLLLRWSKQVQTCSRYNSKYVPTNLIDLCVVSSDLLAGSSVSEMVRYPAISPHSGWYMIGTQFDGKTMASEHVGHVVENRVLLSPYLALEPGFRVWLSDGEVRFDEEVAKSKAV